MHNDHTAAGAGVVDHPDWVEVDAASGFMTRTLMVLKGKTSPETRLSTEELQVVHTDHNTHRIAGKTNENVPHGDIRKTIC